MTGSISNLMSYKYLQMSLVSKYGNKNNESSDNRKIPGRIQEKGVVAELFSFSLAMITTGHSVKNCNVSCLVKERTRSYATKFISA